MKTVSECMHFNGKLLMITEQKENGIVKQKIFKS